MVMVVFPVPCVALFVTTAVVNSLHVRSVAKNSAFSVRSTMTITTVYAILVQVEWSFVKDVAKSIFWPSQTTIARQAYAIHVRF